MAGIKKSIPIGIINYQNTSGILVKSGGSKAAFYFSWKTTHGNFVEQQDAVLISLPNKKHEQYAHCSNVHFVDTSEGWIMNYTRTTEKGLVEVIACADDAYNIYEWRVISEKKIDTATSIITEHPEKNHEFLSYTNGLFVGLETSAHLKKWNKIPRFLFTSRNNHFDRDPLRTIGVAQTDIGIVLFYDATIRTKVHTTIAVGAILFSKDEPEKILWRSDDPVWLSIVTEEKGSKLYPLGITSQKFKTTFYYATEAGDILTGTITTPFSVRRNTTDRDAPVLIRSAANPILEPKGHDWESQAVFNPAAVLDNGKIHLFYRAIGQSGISVLGYAESDDGIQFSSRVAHPIYEPIHMDEYERARLKHSHVYNPLLYTSGGSWNGYEDPRAVKIGTHIYVTYLAFGGWDAMRLAVTSISEKNLEEEIWKWEKPRFISPPGEIHKNWVLFPEKIKGKFAILHSISPEISITYFNSFKEFDGTKFIHSHAPKGGRQEFWDSKVRGVGPPPLKTKLGWLILYHANDVLESYKYKLGAMVLDSKDPTKILYRTSQPILCPDFPYENDGKPGIVYASGAIIKDNTLFVYYGGGDKVVCVASTNLDNFLEKIKKDVPIQLEEKNSKYI